ADGAVLVEPCPISPDPHPDVTAVGRIPALDGRKPVARGGFHELVEALNSNAATACLLLHDLLAQSSFNSLRSAEVTRNPSYLFTSLHIVTNFAAAEFV